MSLMRRKWIGWGKDLVFLAVILVLSVTCLQGFEKRKEQEEKIRIYEQQLQEKQDRLVEMYAHRLEAERAVSFYEEYVVFISDGSNRYHTYGCESFDDSTFWAYNIDQAIDLGYRPCSKCQ